MSCSHNHLPVLSGFPCCYCSCCLFLLLFTVLGSASPWLREIFEKTPSRSTKWIELLRMVPWQHTPPTAGLQPFANLFIFSSPTNMMKQYQHNQRKFNRFHQITIPQIPRIPVQSHLVANPQFLFHRNACRKRRVFWHLRGRTVGPVTGPTRSTRNGSSWLIMLECSKGYLGDDSQRRAYHGDESSSQVLSSDDFLSPGCRHLQIGVTAGTVRTGLC